MNDTSVVLDPEEIDGINVWLLNYASRAANFTVQYEFVKLEGDTNDRALLAIRAFDLGYDCVISSVIHSYERSLYMNFLTPHMPYGFVVVSNSPKIPTDPVYVRLWQWVKPFTWQVWLVVCLSNLAVGLCMFWFDREKNTLDLDSYHVPGWRRELHKIWHGVHLAFAHWCRSGFFKSKSSIPGRILNHAYSVNSRLSLAAYTANLAAFLALPPQPKQIVNSIDDLTKTGVGACILNSTSHQAFVRTNYPLVQAVTVPSASSTAALLDALARGKCKAGVSPDVHIRYSLTKEDTAGRFCSMSIVGSDLNFGYYAIPFSVGTSRAVTDALSTLVGLAIADGTSAARVTLDDNFGVFRNQCPDGSKLVTNTVASTSAAKRLSLEEMSGIFLVQVIGFGIVAGLFVWKWAKYRFWSTLPFRAIAVQEPRMLVVEDLKQQVVPRPNFAVRERAVALQKVSQGRVDMQATAKVMTVARLISEHMGLQHRIRDMIKIEDVTAEGDGSLVSHRVLVGQLE